MKCLHCAGFTLIALETPHWVIVVYAFIFSQVTLDGSPLTPEDDRQVSGHYRQSKEAM
ncbi:hypothetical protein HB780_22490 [Rhizobium lusitanum]|uniref:hypothetical protein n=1 Tax=Rhizobium lusitanum TaxID=293958 RepID=UPI00160D14D2|nr:hypothetical protein [Rhizobium lusitanum]QND48384.1 hypothetical protein HB780_22490 [Rhizobium lusitanum]